MGGHAGQSCLSPYMSVLCALHTHPWLSSCGSRVSPYVLGGPPGCRSALRVCPPLCPRSCPTSCVLCEPLSVCMSLCCVAVTPHTQAHLADPCVWVLGAPLYLL